MIGYFIRFRCKFSKFRVVGGGLGFKEEMSCKKELTYLLTTKYHTLITENDKGTVTNNYSIK